MRLRTFHRWHGLAMSLIVIMSASSGLLHTWMARHQSPPPPARPAGAIDLTAVNYAPALLPGPAAAVSLRLIGGMPWWQVTPPGPGPLRWFDAGDGHEDVTADARYAAEIAQRALSGGAVRQTAYLTAYDEEYIAIFRLLPVYLFTSNDALHTRVYVSTLTGSVTRLTDDAKQVEANTFSLLHKWMFIRNRDLRDWLLMVAMCSISVLACTGVVLFWRSRRAVR